VFSVPLWFRLVLSVVGVPTMSMTPPNVRPSASAIDLPRQSPAEQVLAHAQAGREIVQDFVPLSESLN
jgi:hypothetical protein